MANNIYQTKCRKCGKINDWFHSTTEQCDRQAFLEWAFAHLSGPKLCACECTFDGQTVQDLVSINQE